MTAWTALFGDISRGRTLYGRIKGRALASTGVAVLALMMAQAAAAQDTTEEVTVTGTRVMRDGYSAPTPVTVLGSEDIQQNAPSNLANYINQMPSIVGSTTPDSSSSSVSSGGSGINALNLRGLGVTRTLVLLDGHRQPASSSSGQVDIDTIPQQLVQRVDIVTGGASADYGSDAVGGVVNFILDKTYTGLKGDLEYGQTSDDLQPSYKANLTYGTDFDSGRGHVLLSGEWVNQAPINNYVPKWGNSGYFTIQNPAYAPGNGQPYYLTGPGVGPSEVTPGGLILSGPAKGTYFGTNATVNQFNFGQVSGPWMVGGDTGVAYQDYNGTQSLATGEVRENIYGRASYNITDDVEVYVEGFVNRYKGYSLYVQPGQVGGITIKSDNAFLPQSVKNELAAATPVQTQITMGSMNAGFPESGDRNGREVQHFAGGADGTTTVFGSDWKWELHGQVGVSDQREQLLQTWNTNRLNLASDAVFAPAGNALGVPTGTIVCRSSLANPTNGCAPLSRIGIDGGTQDPAAYQKGIAYVFDTPYRLERLSEQDYSFNVSGNPFDNWEGPVSIAFGGEWRMESINGYVPPQFQSGWDYGNFLVNHGHYSVGEGYVETVVPLLKGLDANGAFRYTAYSTSGGVSTWKGGLTYAPDFLPDIKLRATYSHDIRAPNLADLYAAGTATSNAVLINNISYPITYQTTGNKDLTPENANSLGLGIVFTPSFFDGFTASVDYYNITLKSGINTLAVQQATDLCYKNAVQSFCDNIVYTGGIVATPTNFNLLTGQKVNPGMLPGTASLQSLILQPFNFASQKAEGIDFDITYNVPLDSFDHILGSIPGSLTLRGLATNYMRNVSNNGVSPATDSAGVNATGGIPSWVYRFSATYATDPWTFLLVGRGVSAGVYANENTQCTSGCPAISAPYYTTNNNNIPGAFYVDSTITYDFRAIGADSQAFFSVKNLFDTSPVLVGNGPASISVPARPQTNLGSYDYLGRVLRVGLRFNM